MHCRALSLLLTSVVIACSASKKANNSVAVNINQSDSIAAWSLLQRMIVSLVTNLKKSC